MNLPPTWNRVQTLFSEALELEPEAREALFARESDPEIVREVRSLLSAHEDAGGFLAGSAAQDFSRTAAPGDRIGPYRIIEETGRGGMGVVFRAARDDENFTKEVAIKLIYPGMRSDEIMKRFRAERQILAMLDHPFIARLIDGGTAPDGGPFLVMDYVTGKPLLEYCDERRLGIDRRLGLFLSVCDAVQFAHQRLVIHRDLKPDNILVTEDGTPRLLDFGIAKLVAPDTGVTPATVTAPMNRLLTPDYASPEQIRGEPVTVAGDVYSLGVILYELLAGSRPMEFKSRTPEEILRVVVEDEPVRPSTALTRAPTGETAAQRGETVQRLRRRLAGDLDYIVLKALEKELARRYGSVDQLAQDIRRHLEGLPVLARGQSTAYLLSRFIRRNRAAVVTGAVIAVSLIAGLAGTTWQAGVARRERDRADRRFNEVRELAHALMFDIHDAILDLPGSTKARETLVERALTYLNGLAGDAKDDPGLQYEVGIAYAKIADVQGRQLFSNLGRTTEALDAYTRGLALVRAAAAARPESLSYARNEIVVSQRLADLLRTLGRKDEAWTEARATLSRLEALMEKHPDHPWLPGDVMLTHDRMGDWALADGDTAAAIAERNLCMKMAEELYQKDPATRRGIVIQSCKTADLLAARNDRDPALAAYRRSAALAREAVASQAHNTEVRRDLSIVYGRMASFLASAVDIDSGLAVHALGMKVCEEIAAEDPNNALFQADISTGLFDMGVMLMSGKRYEVAEGRFREAFERFSRLAAADTANVDLRISMARSSRHAGDACASIVDSGPGAGRSQWRSRSLTWFRKSLELYSRLQKDDVLPGNEAAAPAEINRQMARLDKGN